MKKVISLATMLLIMLAATLCVAATPLDSELYSDVYGKLIYLKDFEDGTKADAYETWAIVHLFGLPVMWLTIL